MASQSVCLFDDHFQNNFRKLSLSSLDTCDQKKEIEENLAGDEIEIEYEITFISDKRCKPYSGYYIVSIFRFHSESNKINNGSLLTSSHAEKDIDMINKIINNSEMNQNIISESTDNQNIINQKITSDIVYKVFLISKITLKITSEYISVLRNAFPKLKIIRIN